MSPLARQLRPVFLSSIHRLTAISGRHESTNKKDQNEAKGGEEAKEGHIEPIKALSIRKMTEEALAKVPVEDENPLVPRKACFQELRKSQYHDPIYTIEQAALYEPRDTFTVYWRYPKLGLQHKDTNYAIRGVANEDTLITHFPEVTDVMIVGGGLIGCSLAYYAKKLATRCLDIVVLDKEPYSPHNCTAISNGLISCQSKNRDVSRIASMTKELIRTMRNDVMVTEDDFAQINYRPCTHLILWPSSEVDEVLKATDIQLEDGAHVEVKTPDELEKSFPWLKAVGTDIAIGSHGNQDEALVDPIGLRNLYRTLAQAYGANFIKAEAIDFNSLYSLTHNEPEIWSTGAMVCRMPSTKELRNCSFAFSVLCLSHNTPFLEARSEMNSELRDKYGDLHFLQPKLRICYHFRSFKVPVINFPVITDTDGSMLIRQDISGIFKYYLTYEDSEVFLDKDLGRFMDLESDDPYPNMIHRSSMMKDYFDEVVKEKIVRRIPMMDDAEFIEAHSGFEDYNTFDGSPVLGHHPHHAKVVISAGYGSRLATFAPLVAVSLMEEMYMDDDKTLDLTNFRWDRVITGGRIREFKSLIS